MCYSSRAHQTFAFYIYIYIPIVSVMVIWDDRRNGSRAPTPFSLSGLSSLCSYSSSSHSLIYAVFVIAADGKRRDWLLGGGAGSGGFSI